MKRRAEINEIKSTKTKQIEINKAKSWFFKND